MKQTKNNIPNFENEKLKAQVNENYRRIPVLQDQQDLGIIDIVDAERQKEEILKNMLKTKEMLVGKVHVKRDGTPKKISKHDPTPDYPNGYWYTKITNSYKPKRANREALIDVLLDYYGIIVLDKTLEAIFRAAIHELKKQPQKAKRPIPFMNRIIKDSFRKKCPKHRSKK